MAAAGAPPLVEAIEAEADDRGGWVLGGGKPRSKRFVAADAKGAKLAEAAALLKANGGSPSGRERVVVSPERRLASDADDTGGWVLGGGKPRSKLFVAADAAKRAKLAEAAALLNANGGRPSGQEGIVVPPERRLASDGVEYTFQEFVDYFGHVQGQRLWERRVADDGVAYNHGEFAARFGKPDVEPGGEPWQRAWERAVVDRADELQAGEPDETRRDVEVRFLGGESLVLRGLSPSAPIVGVRGAVREHKRISSMKTVQLMSGTRILQDWDHLSTVEESYLTAVVVAMPLSEAAFDLLSTWHNRTDTEDNGYNLIEIPKSQEHFDFSLVAEILAKTCAKRLIFNARSGDMDVLAVAMCSLAEPPQLRQLVIKGVWPCLLKAHAAVNRIICQSPHLVSCALHGPLNALRKEHVDDLRAQVGGVRITIS